MKRKALLKKIAYVIVLIGGLNWGLLGFFSFDILARTFGFFPPLLALLYDLIGLAALWLIIDRRKY